MAGKLGKLNVEIDATLSKYEAKLKQAEQKARKSGQAAGRNFGDSFSKSTTEKLSKGLAALGAIEAAVKVGSVAVKAFKGDWEGAQAVMETLPFGIGAVASALKELGMELSGINDELREFEKLNQANARRAAKARRGAGVRAGAQRQIQSLEDQNALAGLSGVDKAKAQNEIALRRLREDQERLSAFNGNNEEFHALERAVKRANAIRLQGAVDAERAAAKEREKNLEAEISKRKDRIKGVQENMRKGLAEFMNNIGSASVSVTRSVFGQGSGSKPRVIVDGQAEMLRINKEIRDLLRGRGVGQGAPVAG